MTTTELIAYLVATKDDDDQAERVIVADMQQFFPEGVPEGADRLAEYYTYKIRQVCLPAIRQLKQTAAPHGLGWIPDSTGGSK